MPLHVDGVIPDSGSQQLSLVNPPAFVFRPGGTMTGNVFTSWSDLMAALVTYSGPRTIVFDDSLGACQIPAGPVTMHGIAPGGS